MTSLPRRLFIHRRARWSFGWHRWPEAASGRWIFRALGLGPLELRLYRRWPAWVWREANARERGCRHCQWAAGVLRSMAAALEQASPHLD